MPPAPEIVWGRQGIRPGLDSWEEADGIREIKEKSREMLSRQGISQDGYQSRRPAGE